MLVQTLLKSSRKTKKLDFERLPAHHALETVDQIDNVKETAACAAANATARDRDCQMGLSGAGGARRRASSSAMNSTPRHL
jgi:cysteine synthase